MEYVVCKGQAGTRQGVRTDAVWVGKGRWCHSMCVCVKNKQQVIDSISATRVGGRGRKKGDRLKLRSRVRLTLGLLGQMCCAKSDRAST